MYTPGDVRHTKKVFKPVLTRILKGRDATYEEKEAAFPSYAHRNPLIDLLFWGRLSVSHRLLINALGEAQSARILDFGCGSGVYAYHLAHLGYTVIGTDTEREPLAQVECEITFPDTFSFMSAEKAHCAAPYDAICALDVLEHVEDLSATIEQFRSMLSPGGVVIVSGPTENGLYKLGRKVAGKEFSGEYHVSHVGAIREQMQQSGYVVEEQTLYPFAPLFEIFSFRFSPS